MIFDIIQLINDNYEIKEENNVGDLVDDLKIHKIEEELNQKVLFYYTEEKTPESKEK